MLFTIETTSKKDRTTAYILLVVVLVIGSYVYFFNPLNGIFYPPCWFHELTGLYCAGCGITRASHSFLNGDIQKAIDYNVLFPLLLMIIIFWMVKIGGIFFLKKTIKPTYKPKWAYWTLYILIGVFFLLRNIPHSSVRWLAP